KEKTSLKRIRRFRLQAKKEKNEVNGNSISHRLGIYWETGIKSWRTIHQKHMSKDFPWPAEVRDKRRKKTNSQLMVLLVLLLLRIQRVIQLLPPLRNQPILLLLFATNADGDFRAQGRM